MKNFPAFASHDEVECFKCGSRDSKDVRDCEYPDGLGRWRKTCQQCGLHTYYDLAVPA